MGAAREEVMSGLTDHAWNQLAELEEMHRAIQQNHERVLRSLDGADNSDRDELQIAWNKYREVVAELSRVTGSFESLRLALR
jgi:hypothetical protein